MLFNEHHFVTGINFLNHFVKLKFKSPSVSFCYTHQFIVITVTAVITHQLSLRDKICIFYESFRCGMLELGQLL